uniref:Uncharacterized protein n=1 Tax=Triticum urartu TaxID=4572 RepID=A0A8R7PHR5_TRIUA
MALLSPARTGASSRQSSLQIRSASARSTVCSRIPRPMDSQLCRSPHCWPLLPLHREAAVQAEKDERLDPPAMSPHFACISTTRIHASSKPLPPLLQPTPPAAPSSSSPSSCFPRSRCP